MKKIVFGMLIILMATGCSFTLSGDSKNDVNNDNQKEESYDSLDIDNTVVTELYKKVNHFGDTGPAGYNFTGYFYQKDSIFASEIDNKTKLFLALNNAQTTTDELEQTLFVSDSSLKTAMIDLFGNVDYQNESLTTTKGCGFSNASYNADNKQYSIAIACGGTGYNYYITKLVQARKYSDRIEIYEKHIGIKRTWNEDKNLEVTSVYKYFKQDKNSCIGYDCMSGVELIADGLENFDTNNIDEYMQKADTYKYTFKLENGKYYFSKAEKVK